MGSLCPEPWLPLGRRRPGIAIDKQYPSPPSSVGVPWQTAGFGIGLSVPLVSFLAFLFSRPESADAVSGSGASPWHSPSPSSCCCWDFAESGISTRLLAFRLCVGRWRRWGKTIEGGTAQRERGKGVGGRQPESRKQKPESRKQPGNYLLGASLHPGQLRGEHREILQAATVNVQTTRIQNTIVSGEGWVNRGDLRRVRGGAQLGVQVWSPVLGRKNLLVSLSFF